MMTVSNEMEIGQVVIGTRENPWSGRIMRTRGHSPFSGGKWSIHCLRAEAAAQRGSGLGWGALRVVGGQRKGLTTLLTFYLHDFKQVKTTINTKNKCMRLEGTAPYFCSS